MYKLVVAEDETVIRQGIVNLIGQVSSSFHVVKEASHGKEVLEYFSSEMPDALLTDIRMREMDGLTLIGRLREKYADLPIVILSGYGDFEYAQRALRYGVLDYLLKPIDRSALVAALDKVREQLDRSRGLSAAAANDSSQAYEDENGDVENGEGRRLIRKVKKYIQTHPEGDLRLQTLADYISLNAAYLSQLFKQETGLNLSDYITDTRMERAKYLLTTTDLKIYDVARLSGYQSPKHFMLVFKQQCGVTPGAYREQAQV